MTAITTIQSSDIIKNSRADINNNFTNLNNDKVETSYLDTDTTLSANSDSKIATQKAVRAFVLSGGQANASETERGLVEEATDAEVTAGTAAGATGAKLFVTPAKLATRLQAVKSLSTPVTCAENIDGSSTPVPVFVSNGTEQIYRTQTPSITAAFLMNSASNQGFAFRLTSVGIGLINCVKFYAQKTGNPGGVVVKLLADSGGLPGSEIGTFGTVAGSDISGAGGVVTLNAASAVDNSSTTVWVAFYTTGTYGAGDYVHIEFNGSGSGTCYRNDGTSWFVDDAAMEAYIVLSTTFTAGQLYRSDANDNGRDEFYGFVYENKTSGQSAQMVFRGVLGGFTGLTVGSTYYVSNTIGTISASAGTTSLLVGKAISSTQILI